MHLKGANYKMIESNINIKTEFGTITIVPINDTEFPGVRIDVDQEQVARVEFNHIDKKLNSFLWHIGDDEFTHKISQDINPIEITDEVVQINAIIDDALLEAFDEQLGQAKLTEENRFKMINRIRTIRDNDMAEIIQDEIDALIYYESI